MDGFQYEVCDTSGKWSPPISETQLYEYARQGFLKRGTPIKEIPGGRLFTAGEHPALCVVFQQKPVRGQVGSADSSVSVTDFFQRIQRKVTLSIIAVSAVVITSLAFFLNDYSSPSPIPNTSVPSLNANQSADQEQSDEEDGQQHYYTQAVQRPDGSFYRMSGYDFPADKDHPEGTTYDDNGNPMPKIEVTPIPGDYSSYSGRSYGDRTSGGLRTQHVSGYTRSNGTHVRSYSRRSRR